MFSGSDGLISSSSLFTASATLRTLDFVCLTMPRPIASSPFALRKPLSVSAPISILEISFKVIFLPSIFLINRFLNSPMDDNFEVI